MEKALLPEETPPREVLNGRFRFRTPLRCDGIGKLDCVADLYTGQRKVVRWLPLEVNRHSEQNVVHFCANLPTHSSLPEVCEVGEMETWAYMVVDFPEGDLLAARREFLSPDGWREMARQLSGALNVLHAAQVCHGEFCMPSVMLLEDEQYMLWDMQLVLCSRMADRRQGDRILKQLVRTVATMAPERARGGPLSAEGDVYSLGAVLAYSAGSRQPPSTSTLALVHAIATGNFKPQIPPALPPAYQNMLARMLATHASGRPSMREVEDFFAAPLDTSLSSAPSPDTPSPDTPSPGILSPDTPSLDIPSLDTPSSDIPLLGAPLSGIPPSDIPSSDTPSLGAPIVSSKTLPLFPAPKLSGGSVPQAAAQTRPSTSDPLVSGVDWIHMLSPQEEAKAPAPSPGVAAAKPGEEEE